MALKRKLQKLDACADAVKFAAQFNSLDEAWQACPRGDWMLWLAKKTGCDLRALTLAKAHCAATVKHLMKNEHSLRSLRVLQAAFDFADGKISQDDLANVYDADVAADVAYNTALGAYEDAKDVAYAYATYAAYSTAADAAADPYACSYAPAYAACNAVAAYADYNTTAVAAYVGQAVHDARFKNQKQTADICRRYLPMPKL